MFYKILNPEKNTQRPKGVCMDKQQSIINKQVNNRKQRINNEYRLTNYDFRSIKG